MTKTSNKTMSTFRKHLPFSLLNFRKLEMPTFVATPDKTNSKNTYYDFKAANNYDFMVITPPSESRYVYLGEGGNIGGMYSQTKADAYFKTDILRTGVDEEHQSERDDFFEWLKNTNDHCLKEMYDNDMNGATTAIRAKTAKRYGKNKTAEELEALSLKTFKKNAKVPLKEKDGIEFLTTKMRAYAKDMMPRTMRYFRNDSSEMESAPEIRSGAMLSTILAINPYAISRDNYGISYKLVPQVIVYTTGKSRRESAPMEAIETLNRSYNFGVSSGREGKQYMNITDDQSRGFEFRASQLSVLFAHELRGDGNLGGKFASTEANAKYSSVCKEDIDNPDSVSLFDYMETLQSAVFDNSMQHDTFIEGVKNACRDEAQDIADETDQTFDECLRSVVAERFNGPVKKREQDDHRQVTITQSVFNKGVKNNIPFVDTAGHSVEEDINRGAKISPVLVPSVWTSPNGRFGLSYKISLQHGIRVDSNPEQVQADSGGGGVLYSFKQADNKRKADDMEDLSAKRVRTE